MSVTININGLTLCHKGSNGVTHNTVPDVCKTPDKAIPRPFDNEAYSRDLADGTTTVFADGGMMIANFGSIFAISTLDGGGSFGGIKSGTFLAEAEFMTHSPSVFFEGMPACRLTDKMWMNHKNTVNMAGVKQKDLQKKIQNWLCECHEKTTSTPNKKDGTPKDCKEMGNETHECVDKEKDKDNAKRKEEGKKPRHEKEKGYKVKDNKIEGVDDIAQRRADNPAKLADSKSKIEKSINQHSSVKKGLSWSKHLMGGGGPRISRASSGLEYAMDVFAEGTLDRQIREATEAIAKEERALEGVNKALENPNNVYRKCEHTYPDGATVDDDGKVTELSEYKTVCPKGTPTGRNDKEGDPMLCKGEGVGDWSKGQKDKYEDLLEALKAEGKADSNTKIKKYSTADCAKKGGKKGK